MTDGLYNNALDRRQKNCRVQGDCVRGSDLRRGFHQGFCGGAVKFFGGRSGTYEEELIQARESAISEMEQRAQRLGADAVVGVKLDYEVLGANNGMLMVTASGTAVRLE